VLEMGRLAVARHRANIQEVAMKYKKT
jgi:hypothetical protein